MVLLPPFLMEAVVNYGAIVAESLLKTFADKILIHEADNTPEETGDDEDSESNEDNNNEKSKTRSAKDASSCDLQNEDNPSPSVIPKIFRKGRIVSFTF